MHRLAVFLALVISGTASSASLFEGDDVLEVTLLGPVTAVIDDTEKRRERMFSLAVGKANYEVGVRVRGKSRVLRCRFPPLRLNFSTLDTAGSIFDGQNKLKLVTHCENTAESERNVLEEYAAYRILNALSDISFRARLLRIRYIDTGSGEAEPVVRYGFVIESDKALASRHGGEVLSVRHVTRGMLDPRHSALVYVFQFLIGNTDWSLVRALDDEYCCHNGKLTVIAGRKYFVPYDFDMSGLVNARYARPHPDVKIRSVRVRRYRGYCTDGDTLRTALRTVVDHRDEIEQIIAGLPDPSPKDRAVRSRYIGAFFERAADENKLLNRFERRCL